MRIKPRQSDSGVPPGGTKAALVTGDGESLEARWDTPSQPRAAVVFCHPHPRFGGSMHAPLMNGVTGRLVERGYAVLRFNFRGTGDSSGSHGGGRDEIADVDAAVQTARESHSHVVLAGWSFGGAMVLAWQAAIGDSSPVCGIAPAVGMAPQTGLAPARRRIIIGDRDRLVDPSQVKRYAETIGADLVEMPGSNHFFYFRHDQVADLMADWWDG